MRRNGGVHGSRERGESQSQRLALFRERVPGCTGRSVIPISWASRPLQLPLLRMLLQINAVPCPAFLQLVSPVSHESPWSSLCREFCAGQADRNAPSCCQLDFLCSPLINGSSVCASALHVWLKGICLCLVCRHTPNRDGFTKVSSWHLSFWSAPIPMQQPASPHESPKNHQRDYSPIL